MRKSKLTRRELEICSRLRNARETLGITQQAVAAAIGTERSTIANYETAITPMRYELALRFCRSFVISEEWLATGKTQGMIKSALQHGFTQKANFEALETIFFRQCMDLLSEPICLQIPPGTLFSEAFDAYLAERYQELAMEFFYTPRIVFNDADKPSVAVNLLIAFMERWLKLLGNEALRLKKSQTDVQRGFVRAVFEASHHLFDKFMGATSDPQTLQNLEWLRLSLEKPGIKLGSLHAPVEAPNRSAGLLVTH